MGRNSFPPCSFLLQSSVRDNNPVFSVIYSKLCFNGCCGILSLIIENPLMSSSSFNNLGCKKCLSIYIYLHVFACKLLI